MTQLTELQERFAVEYATNGGDATAAAVAAGYSEKSACDLGRRALSLPQVLERVMLELMRLRARSGAAGLKALIEIAESGSASPAARVSAGRTLLEHAGMIGPAKEIAEARERAMNPDRKVVDYLEVLDALASRRPANDRTRPPQTGTEG